MLISIIIPVYKVENEIKRCLESVFVQSYPHIELILIDDATPDDSFEIAKKLLIDQNQIQYQFVEHSQNRGLSAARNTGIKAARGEYLFFLDSDDSLSDPDAISYLVECSQNNGISKELVVGNFQKIKGKRVDFILASKQKEYADNDEVFKDYAHSKLWVIACAKLINRTFLLKNNLFFKEGIYHEDLLWAFYLYRVAKLVYSTPRIVYNHFEREGSITWNISEKNIQDQVSVILEMYAEYCKNSHYHPTDTRYTIELYRKEVFDWLITIDKNSVKQVNVDHFLYEQILRLKKVNISAKTGKSKFNKQNLFFRLPAWLILRYLNKFRAS